MYRCASKMSWKLLESFSILLLMCLSYTTTIAAPRHVYLTWQGDTSTTITVNYHTMAAADASEVRFARQSCAGDIDAYPYRAVGRRHQIPGMVDGRTVHVVELIGLKPGTSYYFIAGDETTGFSPEHKFRTVPDDDRPIRFITGGDVGIEAMAGELLNRAAQQSPLFGVIGGDIAYANGNLAEASRWDAWLDNWERSMVTPDGHLVPIVAAIGNHEVRGGFGGTIDEAPFYLGYLAQGGRTHFDRVFGRNMALLVLDSGHIVPHDGAQAEWLGAALQRHADKPVRFAVYHVPLYPSFRPYDLAQSRMGRQHWGPLFDRFGLTAAFENHDHMFKRTKMLKGKRGSEAGTVYLGDGCLGIGTRSNSERRWYMEKMARLPHFWMVDVAATGVEYRAMLAEGVAIDVYPPTAAGAAEAETAYQFHTLDDDLNETVSDPAFGSAESVTIDWRLTNPFETELSIAVSEVPIPDAVISIRPEQLRIAPGATAHLTARIDTAMPRNRLSLQSSWRYQTGDCSGDVARTTPVAYRREAKLPRIGGRIGSIEGRLHPELTRNASVIDAFVQGQTGEPATQPTAVWAAAFADGLYIHAVCHDAEMKSRVPVSTPSNSHSFLDGEVDVNVFWHDDLLELFLTADAPVDFVHYATTLGGAVYYERRTAEGECLGSSAAGSVVRRLADRWVVEWSIPWSEFGIESASAKGTVWGLDFARSHNLANAGISRWSNPLDSNHEKKFFGFVRFE